MNHDGGTDDANNSTNRLSNTTTYNPATSITQSQAPQQQQHQPLQSQ